MLTCDPSLGSSCVRRPDGASGTQSLQSVLPVTGQGDYCAWAMTINVIFLFVFEVLFQLAKGR